jgi:hypothetical protein
MRFSEAELFQQTDVLLQLVDPLTDTGMGVTVGEVPSQE